MATISPTSDTWCCELGQASPAAGKKLSTAPAEELSVYALILSGALAGGHVDARTRSTVQGWADRHGIDGASHNAALLQIGASAQVWTEAISQPIAVDTPEKESPHTDVAVRLAGFLLACQAGYVNGLAMSGMYSIAVSHVTGTVTRTALGDGDMGTQAGVVLSFVLGSAICGIMIGKNQVNFGLALYGFALLSTCVLLAIAAATFGRGYSIYFAAAAMGLQNGMATTYSGAVVRTTHMTGCATDIGLVIGRTTGRLLRGGSIQGWLCVCEQLLLNQVVDEDDMRADVSKLLLLLLLFTGFALGGVLGGLAYDWIQEGALYIPVGFSGIVGMGYTLYRVLVLQNKLFDSHEHDELEITYDLIVQAPHQTNPETLEDAAVAAGPNDEAQSLVRSVSHIVPRATRRSGVYVDHDSRRISAVLQSQFLDHPAVFGSTQRRRGSIRTVAAQGPDAVYVWKPAIEGFTKPGSTQMSDSSTKLNVAKCAT